MTVRQALQRLVDKIDQMQVDERFQDVWAMYELHKRSYGGPSYDQELEDAREVLSEDQ